MQQTSQSHCYLFLACGCLKDNSPVHVPSAALTYPALQLNTNDPSVFTHSALAGVSGGGTAKHSFTSSEQVAPVQPGLHVQAPFVAAQVWVLAATHAHSLAQLAPYIVASQAAMNGIVCSQLVCMTFDTLQKQIWCDFSI